MLKTCMCAIGIMFKRNLELHIVRPKPNLLSSCSQSCTTLLEEAVSEEPVTAAAVNELRKDSLYVANL